MGDWVSVKRRVDGRWNKTFNKCKNRALLTLTRSQKHHEIFSNNVLRKNITRKQLRLDTIEIA